MKNWLIAARPRTLPLAVAGILLGLIPGKGEAVPLMAAILTVLTAISLQVLSNFANDLGDTENGADQYRTKGPSRAVQSGALSDASMKKAVVITGAISFIMGFLLLYFTLWSQGRMLEFFGFLLIGCGGIWAAYHYTAGERPYGYRGWGDVSVFLFFGIIAVLGTHYLIYQAWNGTIFLLAFMQGALSSMVLHLNNMRDFEDDQRAGKITLAIKLGWSKSIAYFLILGCLSFVFLLISLIMLDSNWGYFSLLPWLILFALMKKVSKADGETKLDGDLKKVALSSFFIALCLFLTSIS